MIKKILIGAGVIILALVVYVQVDRVLEVRKIKALPTDDEQVAAILGTNGCAACHSPKAKAPFYASFPFIGKTVREDMEFGYKSFDIDRAMQEDGSLEISEVLLSKLEYSVSEGTMPPAKYTALHWKSKLTDKEEDIIMNWVARHRMAKYYTGLNARKFANEPVQALVSSIPTDPAKVELGDILYHDVRLSKDNTVSCATCHDLAAGGVDGLQFSKGIYGQIGGINAPTVYNAAFNVAQFWDGRAADLQAQAGGPPFDALEMGCASWDEIIEKLNKDRALLKKFTKVYPDGFTGENITDAIAEFEKTLLTPDSKFDQYLKGNEKVLTETEVEGYELFKENKCATCHTGQAMGGQSFEHISVYRDYFADRAMKADREIIRLKDQGRFNATGDEMDRGMFKTPILRNISLTAPYFHDGTVLTLEEAVEKMFIYELGKKPQKEDVDRIVEFLKTV